MRVRRRLGLTTGITTLATSAIAHGDPSSVDVRTILAREYANISNARVEHSRREWAIGSRLRSDSVFLDNGDDATRGPAIEMRRQLNMPSLGALPVNPERYTRLQSVVLLRTLRGRQFCTGTLVDGPAGPRILTAAHCMYHTDIEDSIRGRRESFVLEMKPPFAVNVPPRTLMVTCTPVAGTTFSTPVGEPCQVSRSFEACAKAQTGGQAAKVAGCVRAGAQDVALVTISEASLGTARWSLCSTPPVDHRLTIFGYGVNNLVSTTTLLHGSFLVKMQSSARVWTASGSVESVATRPQRVAPGDSGGPVITAADDRALARGIPQLCFVVSSLERRPDAPDHLLTESYGWLQPVWNLDERMIMSIAELATFFAPAAPSAPAEPPATVGSGSARSAEPSSSLALGVVGTP